MKPKQDTGVFNKAAEKKTPVSEMPIRGMDPKRFVVSAWLLTLVISFYGSTSVYRWVSSHKSLSTQSWAIESAEKLARFGDSTGVNALRVSINELADPILNGPVVMAPAPEVIEPVVVDSPVVVVDEVVEPDEKVEESKGLPHTSAARKKRVLIVGASSIQGALGTELLRIFETYEDLDVLRFGKLSTGLVRPDVLDWPKKLDSLAKKFRPDLIIMNFGGNDAQNIALKRYKRAVFGTPEWDVEYAKRVRTMVEIGNKHKALTINLGMPIMRTKKFSKRIKRLNGVTREATEEAGGLYVSTWEMAATPYGGYRKSIRYKGDNGLMRAGDGIHYSRLGARFVADQVTQVLERLFVFESKDQGEATATRHTVSSEKLGRDQSYLAFVPSIASADKKLPVIYLLHDKDGDWESWSKLLHRTLQKAAVTHEVVFVTPDMPSESFSNPGTAAESFILDELHQDVQRHLPVLDERAIIGHGYGGYQAISLGLRHGSRVTKVSSFAANSPQEGATLSGLSSLGQAPYPEIFLSVGIKDDVRKDHDALRDSLKSKGVAAQLLEVRGRQSKRLSEGEFLTHMEWHREQKKPSPVKAPVSP